MASGNISVTACAGGATIQKTISKSFDHPNCYLGVSLSAGKTVTDWVKTDADTAECNLPAEHGYSTGKFDVFWELAGVKGMRYDVDGTVTVNALALDGGTGDDFPATATTGIVACVPQQINTAIDGDAVALFAACCDQRASLYFEDADGDAIAQIELQANEPETWHDTSNVTNPLTGDPITVCWATNGSSTDATLNILVGEDSTP